MRPAIPALLIASLLPAQQSEKGAFDTNQWNRAVNRQEPVDVFGLRQLRLTSDRPETAAVKAGLLWLENEQQPDGSWPGANSKDATVAVTSLGLLAMLGDGSTMRVGPHKAPIKKAVGWLRTQQQQNGAFAKATGPHLLAALAMTECFHLSNYKLLLKSATKGFNYATKMRSDDGGWRASPGEEAGDPALTLWGTTLLVTARAAGIAPKQDTCSGVLDWLRSPQATAAPQSGILGVPVPMVRQGELAHDQSAANAFTLCWLAIEHRDSATLEAMKEYAATMTKNALARAESHARVWAKNPKHKLSINEWFCSNNALAQAGNEAGVAKITNALREAQVTEGDEKGSWQAIGVWGEAGGRAWTTAMAVLTLEAPYRYGKIIGR